MENFVRELFLRIKDKTPTDDLVERLKEEPLYVLEPILIELTYFPRQTQNPRTGL